MLQPKTSVTSLLKEPWLPLPGKSHQIRRVMRSSSLLVSQVNYQNEHPSYCRIGSCRRPKGVSHDTIPLPLFQKPGNSCQQSPRSVSSGSIILHGPICTTKSPSSGPPTGLKVSASRMLKWPNFVIVPRMRLGSKHEIAVPGQNRSEQRHASEAKQHVFFLEFPLSRYPEWISIFGSSTSRMRHAHISQLAPIPI
jgi:hypothetical protein